MVKRNVVEGRVMRGRVECCGKEVVENRVGGVVV